MSKQETIKPKEELEFINIHIHIGDDELQYTSESQIQFDYKAPTDWSDAILLLQHEPIRYELNFLKIIYTNESVMNPNSRKLLAKWFRDHISFVIDRHEHLEQLIWKKVEKQKHMAMSSAFDYMEQHLNHEKLEKILDDMHKHLLDLSTKEQVSENDVQVHKVDVFVETILDHLKSEEQNLPPILKNYYTNEEGLKLLKSIFKAQEDEIKILMPWFMNQITKWAPSKFQQILTDQEYEDQNKEYVTALGEFSGMWTENEVNQLLDSPSPLMTQRQQQAAEITDLEAIQEMYKVLGIDVKMIEIQVVSKACKYCGIDNLAFFFARLTLFEELMLIITLISLNSNLRDEYEKVKRMVNQDDNQKDNDGKHISTRLLTLSKDIKNDEVADNLKIYSKKYYRQVKVDSNKCDEFLQKMQRFRVEGVDDTFYGVFLALYLAGAMNDMQTPIRIGSGLTALYLFLVNMNGIKQLISQIPSLFSLDKWNFFLSSLTSWEGWQEVQFRNLIEDLAFIGMDLTFMLKALDQVGDKFVIMSNVVTQGMMVVAAIYNIMEHLINIKIFDFAINSIQYLNYTRDQLPEKAYQYCLKKEDIWELKSNMIFQKNMLKKLIKIMIIFAIFEFGLVIFSIIAICDIDLKSKIIEYYGPTLTAVIVLSSQIIKQIVESKDKTSDLENKQRTLLSKIQTQ